MTGFVGALVEAWDELRIHKLRVLLSLIGVAAAVMAITGVTAAVQMFTQAMREQGEQASGRSATLSLNAYSMTGSTDAAAISAALDDAVDRYGIAYASRTTWTQMDVDLPGGTELLSGQFVDPDYGTIHRTSVAEGRWFTDADTDRFAPTVIVNQAFLDRLGVADLSGHPTVVLRGTEPVRAEVIGVRPTQWPGEEPGFFVLQDQADRWGLAADVGGPAAPSMEVWVPPADADVLIDRLTADLTAALPGMQVNVSNYTSNPVVLDRAARWVIIAVSGFALLLGGLGLVNIALVTVRHRIREIGIRRSFGATSGRVFFGVLMESVVATVVAGVIGVALAVVGISKLPVERLMGTPIQDMPPFPLSAALLGLVCAAGVGALAGLMPAVFAVRVKVIDAIRY
ncbi:MAG TPA: ABC transporter permease [Cellulomonas sp.]